MNNLKIQVLKAIEESADIVLSIDILNTISNSINQKYKSFVKTCGVYLDKHLKNKMVIAIGNIDGVRFVFQIDEKGEYIASVNSKKIETESLPITTAGAALVVFNRVIERAKIVAKAINNQDILKDKIYIGSSEEASFITKTQVKEVASRASEKIEIPASVLKTKKTAIDFVKKAFPGLTLTWNAEWEEFVVKIKGKPKSDYHTNDLKDAVQTARSMYENR